MSEYLIEVQGLERSFGTSSNPVRVLRGLDLCVEAGNVVALYGPSGSGKTTLLNLIGALDRPNAGTILMNGQDIVKMGDGKRAKLRRTQIGFIFQTDTLLPTYSAMENIDLALRLPRLGIFERRRRAQAALQAVGLSAWASHVPDELSGGQRQRVSIARALALHSSIILADEPTNGLDTRTARHILTLFRNIAKERGTTLFIVSHDPIVVDFVDHAYDLVDGRLAVHPIPSRT